MWVGAAPPLPLQPALATQRPSCGGGSLRKFSPSLFLGSAVSWCDNAEVGCGGRGVYGANVKDRVHKETVVSMRMRIRVLVSVMIMW